MSGGLTRRRQAYGYGPPTLPAPVGPQGPQQLTLTLREYVDLRLYELDKRMEQSGALYLAANAERQNAMDKRLEGMNEVRAQLNRQATTFARSDRVEADLKSLREYVDQRIGALETLARTLSDAAERIADTHYTENRKRIEALELFQANIQGRVTAYSGLAVLVSAAVAVVLHFIH